MPQAVNHGVLPHAVAKSLHHVVQSSWTKDGTCTFDCDRPSIEELRLLAVKAFIGEGEGDSTDGNEERVSGLDMLLYFFFVLSYSLKVWYVFFVSSS